MIGMTFNLDDLTRKLSAFNPEAMPRTIQDVSVYLAAQVKRRFASQQSPDGEMWEPLKAPRERPRDKRAKGGSGQKPLRDSGLLMASATGQGEGGVTETGPLHLVQGSNLEYAAIHNFGGVIFRPERTAPTGGGKAFWSWIAAGTRIYTKKIRAHTITIPKRQFIGLSEKDIDRITRMAVENITNGTP